MTTVDNNWNYAESSASWRRDLWIPLLLALLIHLLLFLAIPDQFMSSVDSGAVADEPIELTLVPAEPLTPEELKYVEVNPEAPENKPDPTNQYSFRDQQAADMKESSVQLQAPNVDGEEADSQKILQGAVEETPPLPPGVYAEQAKQGEGEGSDGGRAGAQAQAEAVPESQPRPAPDFLQQEAETEDGTGSSLAMLGPAKELYDNPDPNAPIDIYKPQPKTPAPQQQAEQGDGNGGTPEAQPTPRARPRLSPELIHGPLAKSQGSSPRRGALGLDATFSEFGEYEQQFYAALQAGWYQEIEFFQPIDTATRVVVRFKILSDGTIVGTQVVSSNASEIATLICETAITKRSPFRPWTKEMVQVFGNERVMTVSFRYL